jgi:hypothetical protein
VTPLIWLILMGDAAWELLFFSSHGETTAARGSARCDDWVGRRFLVRNRGRVDVGTVGIYIRGEEPPSSERIAESHVARMRRGSHLRPLMPRLLERRRVWLAQGPGPRKIAMTSASSIELGVSEWTLSRAP